MKSNKEFYVVSLFLLSVLIVTAIINGDPHTIEATVKAVSSTAIFISILLFAFKAVDDYENKGKSFIASVLVNVLYWMVAITFTIFCYKLAFYLI